jgi:hypothetical protein
MLYISKPTAQAAFSAEAEQVLRETAALNAERPRRKAPRVAPAKQPVRIDAAALYERLNYPGGAR